MKYVCRLRDGKTNINPHHPFTKEELDEIFAIAKKYSPKYHAMVRLLYDEAARIQDVIGVPFKDILCIKPNKNTEDIKSLQVCPPIKNTDDCEMISTSIKNTAANTSTSINNELMS